MTWHRRDWLWLLALTLLAASLRFYKLGEVPPGFQFDEAFNAIDAEQVWYGNRPLFLPANGGREPLYTYYQAALGTFLGFTVYSLRLASALAGIVTIPVTYWLLCTLLRQRARTIALFTSLTLAISFWHLHFSHYGIRVIMMPLLLSGLFGCFWLATQSARRPVRWWAILGSGLLTGLTVWTHPSGRFVPFILVGYTLWLWWRHPSQRRLALTAPVGVLTLTGLIAALVFLPLGLEFYRHPEFFFGHASEVSIFAPRVGGDAPWRALLQNGLRVLGMFAFHGDEEWIHNLASRPVFEAPLAICFGLGLVLWLGRLARRRKDDPDVDALFLLALWSLVMLLPSVLSDAAPNFSRALPALPALFVPVGLGLAWLATWPQPWAQTARMRWLPAWSGLASSFVLLAICGVWASYDYFVRFPSYPASYYAYDADKLDALAALEAMAAKGYKVYLQPLWGDHATFTFLRNSATVKALDTAETLVLPPVGHSALYAFPGEKLDQAEDLAALWPGVVAEEVHDRYDKRLLAWVKVDADQLTTWPARYQSPNHPITQVGAHFDDGPTLLGMQSNPTTGEVVLFWQAEQATYRNLTAFLHFIDVDGRRVAQVDKLPGNGSYQTPAWSPGERVIERYYPELADPCGGDDPLDLVVGWYELAADGQRRPRLDAEGDSAVAGQVTLPQPTYLRSEIALPNPVDLTLTPDLHIVGYQVQTDPLRPGAPATVDLYWADGATLPTSVVTLQLLIGEETAALWQGFIAPTLTSTPKPDAVLCRRMHVQLPGSLAAGNYQLTVAVGTAHVALTTIAVQSN
ncbi:MAG: hypothetical protein R3C14_36625 [Caldilineaceae bacterium]